jgi:hypothetical protein
MTYSRLNDIFFSSPFYAIVMIRPAGAQHLLPQAKNTHDRYDPHTD